LSLHAEIVTLFPEFVAAGLGTSILGRAAAAGHFSYALTDLRQYGMGSYRRVDDEPYGGGAGMVLRPEPVFAAVEAAEGRLGVPCRRLMPSPQGRPFDHAMAAELAAEPRPLLILCGHYEGVDERVRLGLGFEEVSIGDYVLTGGELPALVILDAAVRLLEGVLGDARSAASDTFAEGVDGLLKYPQYTRPATFRGMEVPAVLRSGNHAEVERWRREQSRESTRTKRPDLLPGREG
jgi:tRNA (guanine37-N1)-methyltransferase